MNKIIALLVHQRQGLFLICFIFLFNRAHAQNNPYQPIITQRSLLNGASVFTIEFWVKTIESKGNNIYWQRPYLFGNETTGDNSGDFGITTNFGYVGMFEGISSLNTDQQFLSTSIRLNDNFWHHVAAVNNGQTLNLYIDGNIVGSLVSGRQLNTTTAPLTFGAASLDHNFAGNSNNTNFSSQSYFSDARISNNARYTSNFKPTKPYSSDGNTVAIYPLGINNSSGNNRAVNLDPNKPVIVNPELPINNSYAQSATLYINDSIVLYGKLLIGKKDWTLRNELYIRFFENNSKKVKYFKPEEIKGFQMGDSYYEPKFLAGGGGIRTALRKTIVKRLTPANSKMALYECENHYHTNNIGSYTENKDLLIYFVQLPNTKDDKIYQFTDNKFTPKFESKVSALVSDKPALAEKIRLKDNNFFYSQISGDKHQLHVWWNIINEYNKP